MTKKDQGFPPPAVEAGDVVAFTVGLLEPLAVRYRRLAERARETGHGETAALFAELAAEEEARIARIRERARTSGVDIPAPRPVPAGLLEEEPLQSLELWERRPELATPYRVLAVAVRLQEVLFRLCSGLGATAKSEEAERFAEEIAREALAEAARLRVRRRTAYRAAEPRELPAGPSREVRTVEELEEVARRIEAELADRLRAACRERPALAIALERRPALAAFRHLVGAEEREGAGASPTACPEEKAGEEEALARLRLFLERAFEFYDRVFAAAAEEAVMRRAQERMQDILALLQLLDESGSATGPVGAADERGGKTS